jgi:hypothetical protein
MEYLKVIIFSESAEVDCWCALFHKVLALKTKPGVFVALVCHVTEAHVAASIICSHHLFSL